MFEDLFEEFEDYNNQTVFVGLSGGINSAAALIWLCNYPVEFRPKCVHLYYGHFKEHSDDTLPFVLDLWTYAKDKFDEVIYYQSDNSVLEYFEGQKMIPHPTMSPCTHLLKINPMNEYKRKHNIKIDVIGYVRHELRRYKRMETKAADFNEKRFPIIHKDDNWCLDYVKTHLGWYPKIYDIKERGKRVFLHNNCLPCKNMGDKQLGKVAKYFPEKAAAAMELSDRIGSYWGRGDGEGCNFCKFD